MSMTPSEHESALDGLDAARAHLRGAQQILESLALSGEVDAAAQLPHLEHAAVEMQWASIMVDLLPTENASVQDPYTDPEP